MTNTRTTSKDDSTKLKPITPMILEKAIDFIKDDERIEITPKSIRMRKIVLDADYRKTRYFYKKKK